MVHLCDVNILLALCHGQHEHHAVVSRWVEDGAARASMVLCRVTQLALLRLMNNPAVMGDQVCSGAAGWRIYDLLLSDERFVHYAEPPGMEETLRRLTANIRQSPKLWQDAYLAAFAQTAGIPIVTLDAGFRQFRGVRSVILAARRNIRTSSEAPSA